MSDFIKGYALAFAVFILWFSAIRINKNLHSFVWNRFVQEIVWFLLAFLLTGILAQGIFDAQVRR